MNNLRGGERERLEDIAAAVRQLQNQFDTTSRRGREGGREGEREREGGREGERERYCL